MINTRTAAREGLPPTKIMQYTQVRVLHISARRIVVRLNISSSLSLLDWGPLVQLLLQDTTQLRYAAFLAATSEKIGP